MTTVGHNSKRVRPGPVNGDRLKSFIERIEKLEEERKAIGGDIKDVYAEAKGVGYDVKTMRKVIVLRAMDAADRAEQETLIDTYMHALGMIDRVEARVASGESIRKAAKAEGMPKSTAIRQVTQNRRNIENGSPPIGSGEDEASACTAPEGQNDSIGDQQTPPESAEDAVNIGISDDQQSCGQTAATVPAVDEARVSAATSSPQDHMHEVNKEVGNARVASPEPEVASFVPPVTDNSDGMDIPSFLRRERASA